MTCVTTFYTDSFAPLAAITVPVLERYCEKNGYHYNINRIPDGKFQFVKTKNTRKLLDAFSVVLTVDIDTMIMNHTVKIEDFINDDKHFYLTKDINNYNAGVFITKSSKWSKDWLDFINSHESTHDDEQNILEQYCDKPEIQNSITILPHPSINSIPYDLYSPSYGKIGFKEGDIVEKPTHEQGDYQHGDFLIHLPGMTLTKRIEIFNEYRNKIIYE